VCACLFIDEYGEDHIEMNWVVKAGKRLSCISNFPWYLSPLWWNGGLSPHISLRHFLYSQWMETEMESGLQKNSNREQEES